MSHSWNKGESVEVALSSGKEPCDKGEGLDESATRHYFVCMSLGFKMQESFNIFTYVKTQLTASTCSVTEPQKPKPDTTYMLQKPNSKNTLQNIWKTSFSTF
jgi:hypothetical protein